MNFLWPVSAGLRIPCRNSQSLFQKCQKLTIPPISQAARCSIRPYTMSSIAFRRRESLRASGNTASSTNERRQLRFKSTKRKPPPYTSGQVITEFARLPQGYEDGEGLAFRARPLTQAEAHKIFGKITDAQSANQMLRVIHGRRVAGTLEDPNLPNSWSEFDSRIFNTGLQWLRENVSVNEVANAGLRAEQELAELEGEILTDAERIGLYQPNSGVYPQEEGGVYGKGVFQKMREAEKARLDKQDAEDKVKMSQADEIRQNTGTLATINRRSWVSLRTETTNPKILAALEKGKITPDDAPPVQMTSGQRMWPSAILLAVILGGCYVFVDVYHPPKKSDRLWPDMPPSAATIISIILINTGVFCAWRIPPLWRTLNKYFVQVPAYPYAFSLIGNVFSHQTIKHLGLNMAVLWFVGTRLHDEVGRGNFLGVYIASGVFGSFASLAYRVAMGSLISSSLGASGAICGVVACYFSLNSSEKVTIMGVFPPEDWPSISSMMLLGLLIAGDVYGLLRKGKSITIDHFAHLGGYTVGIASALALKEKLRRKKETEMERRKNLGIIDRIKEGRL